MKNKTILLSLILTILFLGCSSGPLTEKDNNTSVEYALDTPFQIQLTSDHSSQNKWKLISNNMSSIIFEKVNMTTKGDKDVYTFNFLVKNMGNENIEIVYENDEELIKTFKLDVICGTMGRILSE